MNFTKHKVTRHCACKNGNIQYQKRIPFEHKPKIKPEKKALYIFQIIQESCVLYTHTHARTKTERRQAHKSVHSPEYERSVLHICPFTWDKPSTLLLFSIYAIRAHNCFFRAKCHEWKMNLTEPNRTVQIAFQQKNERRVIHTHTLSHTNFNLWREKRESK